VGQIAADAPRPSGAAAVQLHREQSEGNLRGAVGPHRVVALLRVEIVPKHRVLVRGDAHLAGHGRAPGRQERKQLRCEREVTQVVGRELQLESIDGGLTGRRRHHARVVDEDMDRTLLAQELFREDGHRCERRQVERTNLETGSRNAVPDALRRRTPPGVVAHREHNLGARPGKARGDVEPDTVARSRHKCELAGQVGNGDVDVFRHGNLLEVSGRCPRGAGVPCSDYRAWLVRDCRSMDNVVPAGARRQTCSSVSSRAMARRATSTVGIKTDAQSA
jgi:hypothetical protein